MSKHFYTDVDFRYNQSLKFILEHLDSTTISSGMESRLFWCTVNNRPGYWDGTQVRFFAYDGQNINAGDVVTDSTHLFVTQTQIDQWNSASQVNILNNLDARLGVVIKTFDRATLRAAKLSITIEDNDGSGTIFEDINLLYDGNYPTFVEFGILSSALSNEFVFYVDYDMNNIYLYVQSNSSDFNSTILVRELLQIDNINPVLTPQVDLGPNDNLYIG